MKRYFVITVLAFVTFVYVLSAGLTLAFAGTKPDLRGFNIAGQVLCPDTSGDVCLMIYKDQTIYVVKGEGFQREEAIWHVDPSKFKTATDKTDPKEYLKLVWKRGKMT